MPRTCIICGVPANSREHIFPAALGGLRVNRGIYCETHNNGFGHLADVLSRQFGMFNALLGVRDRDRRPRVLNAVTPEGDDVVVSAGRVRRVPSDAAGLEGTIHLQLTLGGPEGLPAIGYVALTFFAHYFGDIARQDGLAPVKAFIQGQGENHFAWWESEARTRALPANPFAFGHTIILTTSTLTGEACALISIFQTLTFGIALGQMPEPPDRTVTIFIDPHADRQPVDTQEQHSHVVDVQIAPPEPMHAHLQRLVHDGQGQTLMQDLMARIERWHFGNEMGPALLRLNAARGLPSADRVREIQQIVEAEVNRVYRVMSHAVDGLRQQLRSQPETARVSNLLDAQVAINEDGSTSDTAQASIAQVLGAFIVALNDKLTQEDADMDYLWTLFSGGPGIRLATRTMLQPIMAAIGAPQGWDGNAGLEAGLP